MISIKLEKGYLDLPTSLAISMNVVNPMFRSTVAQESFSYPITLPLTKGNKTLLGFANRLDSTNDWAKMPCQLAYKGVPLMQGVLQVTAVNETTLSAFISSLPFDSAKLDISLKQIELGGVRAIVPSVASEMAIHANSLVNANSDTSDYVFAPILNRHFYDENAAVNSGSFAPHIYCEVINLWDFKAQSYFTFPDSSRIDNDGETANYSITAFDPKASTLVPFPFVVSVLKHIAASLGLSLSGDWIKDSEIKTLIIYNTYCLDSFDGGTTPRYKNDADINLANHLPDISIKDFLDALKNTFNLFVEVSNGQLFITANKWLLERAKEQTISVISHQLGAKDESNNIKSVALTPDNGDESNIFGNIEVTNKVLGDGTFGGSEPFGSVRFDPVTYSARIYMNGFSRTTVETSGYVFAPKNGSKTVTSKAGTLKTERNIVINYAYADITNRSQPISYLSGIIPIAGQKGNSVEYKFENAFSLRLMFYRGMFPDPNGFGVYPIASENVYDDQGNQIGNYSLKWRGGAFSLSEKWWSGFSFGRSVTLTAQMNFTEILNFAMKNKVRAFNRLYLAKSLKYTLTHSQVKNVYIESIEI